MENVLGSEVDQIREEGRGENGSLPTEKLGRTEETDFVDLLENIGMKNDEQSNERKVSLPRLQTDNNILDLGAGEVVDDVDDFGTVVPLKKGPVQNEK